MNVEELLIQLIEHLYTFEYKYIPSDIILVDGLNLVSIKVEECVNTHRYTFHCENSNKSVCVFSAYSNEKLFSKVQVLATIKEINL